MRLRAVGPRHFANDVRGAGGDFRITCCRRMIVKRVVVTQRQSTALKSVVQPPAYLTNCLARRHPEAVGPEAELDLLRQMQERDIGRAVVSDQLGDGIARLLLGGSRTAERG